MINCQPQKWTQLSRSLNIRALHEPLRRMVDGGEDGVAGKGKDGRVGVQRPQTPERREREPQIELRQRQLQRDQDPDQNRHHAPEDRDRQKCAHDAIVVDETIHRRPPVRSRDALQHGLARINLLRHQTIPSIADHC